MIFTGKNKEQFEKWYREFIKSKDHRAVRTDNTYIDLFNEWLFEMQSGVYLEYLDSVGYRVEMMTYTNATENKEATEFHFNWMINDFWDDSIDYPTRQEALTEAFKKADELINK